MKKEHILGILFFSGLWGISEALLGGVLYEAEIAHASVILTVIGLFILTFASAYFPQKGTATVIAGLAMLYKFLNAPFFACHFLGIFLTGLCYDLFFNVLKIRNRSVSAVATVYASYSLFALMITYLARYEYWVQGGFGKVLNHIGVGGTIAALLCAITVPLSHRFAERLKISLPTPFVYRRQLLPGSVLFFTAGLWVFGLAVNFFS
jgi:hypothetical protein